VFIHGSQVVCQYAAVVRKERGVDAKVASISGYGAAGHEESFRQCERRSGGGRRPPEAD